MLLENHMIKYLILGLLALVVFTITSCANKDKKNEVVLGQELANANEKEQERMASGDFNDSPMPEYNYSKWPNEKSLINPQVNSLDSLIISLTIRYAKSNDSIRHEIRNSLSQDDLYTLFTFCQRAAIFGLKGNGDKVYLENALNTLSMVDSERCDFRDALVAMAFANHGIKKAGLNSEALYDEAIKLANPRMAELLSGFQSRTERDKTLETMAGYTEFQTEYGTGFVQCGYDKFEPKSNISEIGFEILKFIETEKYQMASMSVAESLPLIWVNGEGNSELKDILHQSRGTISVSAYPKEEFCEEWLSQMFLLYLIECENGDDAKRIVEMVNDAERKSFYRMVLNIDEMFCILIARSVVLGEDSCENDKSIKRFKAPLEQLIREKKSN